MTLKKNSTILFIANEYHKKTKSSNFFLSLLQKYFDIQVLWIDVDRKVDENIKIIEKYETIIFWQFLAIHKSYQSILKEKNTVLIPMYDSLGAYQNNGLLKINILSNFKNFKVINFSKYLNKQLSRNKIANVMYVQYAPVILKSISKLRSKKRYKIFFWQRRNEITWNELKQLINSAQIESIHIHKSVDPNMTFIEPTQEEIKKFDISFSEWFDTKEDYIKKVKECDIYVSPRLFEGIGMSFLEAMSLGKCVIAPNFPTMNEYIINNENGLLYDIKNLKKLDLSKANDLGFNAYKTIEEISKTWKQSEQKIIDFIIQEKQILEPQKKNIIKQKEDKNFNIYKSIEKVCSLSFFKSPIKKYKAYKSMMKTYYTEKNKLQQKRNNKDKIKRILIVFPHNPFLLQNGVQTRFYELIKYLTDRNYSVDILSHTNFVDKWDEKHTNHKLSNKVCFNDFKKSKSDQTKINSVLPDFAFASLEEQLKQLQEINKYDVLLMSYVHWANIVKDIKNVKKYIMIEDFISMNNYERNNGKYNLGQSINEEIERINLFNKAICISKEEASFFERACKGVEFYHVPHFLESKFSEVNKDTDIVFVGSDNPFNKDGMIWFLEYVMPILGNKYKIKIIGRVNEHLEKYKNIFKNIEFINYVESLDGVYDSSKISICPLQGGTGLKIKVVESLSYGIPVVSTKYGIVGMDNKYNGCLVVDEPQEFANEIKSILEDEQKYKNLQIEAKEYFVKNFSKESVYKKLDKVFFE